MRKRFSKAIILLTAILATSSAFSAPLTTTVTLGSREFHVNSSPVAINGVTYLPLDIVSLLSSSYISTGKSVEITLPSGDIYDVPAIQHGGQTLISMADLAKVADVTAAWEPKSQTLQFVPHITDVEYLNGVLTIRCNYAVRFKARSFDALNVYAVDVSPAKLDSETKALPIFEGGVNKARVGQFSPSEVRIALDLSKPTKLVAAVGKKPNEISIPVAPKAAPPKPKPAEIKPVATTTTPAVSNKPQVTGFTFQSVDEERSKLLITTTGKVTTKSFVLKEPDRLVVDLIGAKLGPGSGQETPVSDSVVQSIRAAQFQENPDIVRIVVDLTRPVGFSIMQSEPTQVVVDIGVPQTRHGLQGATIVIDPGHGGSDSGALTPDKTVMEKTVNLAVARRLSDLLQAAGAYAILTRYTDTAVELAERPKLAADMKADLFVSLHCNSLGVSEKVCGTQTYYHNQNSVCRKMASYIQDAVTQAVGAKDLGALSDTRRFTSGFSVLRNATVPAVLVEMGFLDHSADRKKLVNSDYQQKYAQGVLDGIKAFLGGESLVKSSPEVNSTSNQP